MEEKIFLLIGRDVQNNLTGPIAKKTFTTEGEAASHAVDVLNSGGNPNLQLIYIMGACAVARRTHPPVEIVPVQSRPGLQAAE